MESKMIVDTRSTYKAYADDASRDRIEWVVQYFIVGRLSYYGGNAAWLITTCVP
jgi:hypothetical protein